jgi:cob(I)alamin adenosyltransferase
MSVITKRGDSGETDLMFGRRSPKTAPRIEAYGTVDELNSRVSSRTVEMLDGVQARLVGAMGELATMEEDLPKYDAKGYARIKAEDVAWLEEQAHLLEKECDIRFKGWARPGKEGSLGSAYLDLARSVCRRAERRVVALRLDHALSNVNTALFLNRLSDLCWVLARFEALAAGEKIQA